MNYKVEIEVEAQDLLPSRKRNLNRGLPGDL